MSKIEKIHFLTDSAVAVKNSIKFESLQMWKKNYIYIYIHNYIYIYI